jgi:hypothetical protein
VAEEPVAPAGRLDADDVAALLARDKNTGLTDFEARQCQHCRGLHSRACPRIKRIKYDTERGGAVAEVEYWRDDEWSDAHVIWPEDLGVIGDKQQEGGGGG